MPSFSMTLGGTTLPMPRHPEPYRMEYIPFGGQRRMANGALRVQLTAARWRVTVSWEGLTKAERDVLWTQWGTYIATSAVVLLPDGLTFTAMTALGSWQEGHYFDPRSGVVYYDVSFGLEQV